MISDALLPLPPLGLRRGADLLDAESFYISPRRHYAIGASSRTFHISQPFFGRRWASTPKLNINTHLEATTRPRGMMERDEWETDLVSDPFLDRRTAE